MKLKIMSSPVKINFQSRPTGQWCFPAENCNIWWKLNVPKSLTNDSWGQPNIAIFEQHSSLLSISWSQINFNLLLLHLQVSKAAADLMAYCDAHSCDDPLISPVPTSENPFREKKFFCAILWASAWLLGSLPSVGLWETRQTDGQLM